MHLFNIFVVVVSKILTLFSFF